MCPANRIDQMESKSLESLESDEWSDPESPSHLTTECHRLRKIPISEFSVENIRIMLSQDIGTKHLLPLALEVLEDDPLAEGDYYPGDLLSSVLNLPSELWNTEKVCASRVDTILESLQSIPAEVEQHLVKYRRSR